MPVSQWIDEHLETFVRPRLNRIPNRPDHVAISNSGMLKDVNINALVQMWKHGKELAGDRVILLPGRDAHLFEVVARHEGERETIFRPEISTPVSSSGLIKEDFRECFLLDSGYKGTIARNLGVPNFAMASFTPHYDDHKKDGKVHKLESAVGSTMCGNLEGAPKYWNSAYVSSHLPYNPVMDIQYWHGGPKGNGYFSLYDKVHGYYKVARPSKGPSDDVKVDPHTYCFHGPCEPLKFGPFEIPHIVQSLSDEPTFEQCAKMVIHVTKRLDELGLVRSPLKRAQTFDWLRVYQRNLFGD